MSDEIRRELAGAQGLRAGGHRAARQLSLAAFSQGAQKQRFTEIDVERINIVEPDGSYRMVISNRPRSIGPIYKGKPFGYPGGTRPGIIFFNDEGTENGGLTFTGKKNADGTYAASSGFSFDQFNQDQVLYFQHTEENGRKRDRTHDRGPRRRRHLRHGPGARFDHEAPRGSRAERGAAEVAAAAGTGYRSLRCGSTPAAPRRRRRW